MICFARAEVVIVILIVVVERGRFCVCVGSSLYTLSRVLNQFILSLLNHHSGIWVRKKRGLGAFIFEQSDQMQRYFFLRGLVESVCLFASGICNLFRRWVVRWIQYADDCQT